MSLMVALCWSLQLYLGAAAAAVAVGSSPSSRGPTCTGSCTNCSIANATSWQGKQLLNISFDLPLHGGGGIANVPVITCCGVAQGAASRRSRNSSDPVPWSVVDVGPAQDPERRAEGERSYLCTVYDYGARPHPLPPGAIAATTPALPFMPPSPPPPAPCSSYSTLAVCPKRCFWGRGACGSSPPIECGSNTPGSDHRNNAICVHLILDTSTELQLHLTGTTESFNETIIHHPPALVSAAQDAWWSVNSGVHWAPPPPSLHPFRFCVQYASANGQCDAFSVLYLCFPRENGMRMLGGPGQSAAD